MRKIAAFDFDGTLTSSDSFIALLSYAFGWRAVAVSLLRFAPLIVLMKLHLYANQRAKERMFTYFFAGMPLTAFDALCLNFASGSRHLLRPEAVEAVEQAQAAGAEVVIVSASMPNWVQPFFPTVRVIGTQVEVSDGLLTGRFATANCYGQEKVNRLVAVYPQREQYHLTAYGDSRGDRELLRFADESHYKPFR